MSKYRLIAKETVPVADGDGTLLGFCTVSKFTRRPGLPFNCIEVRDVEQDLVAEIQGYRLHSVIHCGDLEANGPRIDSKDAVAVARVALGRTVDLRRLSAIQKLADDRAAERAAVKNRLEDDSA